MDFLAALALMVIFLWPAGKLTASDFMHLSRQADASAKSLYVTPTVDPAASLSLPQPLPDGHFHFDARFASSSPGRVVHAASIVELAIQKQPGLQAIHLSTMNAIVSMRLITGVII